MSASAPFKIIKAPALPAPTGRRPIGFRGNHAHKKALYDPVYRTTKVPSNLVPRFPIDWRNGGRAILTAALHKLEVGRRISGRGGAAASAAAKRLVLRHRRSLQWQEGGFCSVRCGSTCSKSPWRCLCAWRCGGIYQHINRMDAILMSHKGPSSTQKPLFSVNRPQSAPSRLASEGMIFCDTEGDFVVTRAKAHPAFDKHDAAVSGIPSTGASEPKPSSRAVWLGLEDDSGADSDSEDLVDDEADALNSYIRRS